MLQKEDFRGHQNILKKKIEAVNARLAADFQKRNVK